MTPSTVLITLGTPFGSWLPAATELLGHASGGADLRRPAFSAWHGDVLGERPTAAPGPLTAAQRSALAALAMPGAAWGGLDLRACWTADVLAEVFPEARFLIYVESPVDALAAWLEQRVSQHGSPHDGVALEREAGVALALWQASAQRLLRHAQRSIGRCLLVDATEARRQPEALAALCRERLGVGFEGPMERVESAHDAVGLALGLAVAARVPKVAALHAELQASCAPLDDAAPVRLPTLAEAVDAPAAMASWCRSRSELDELRRQVGAAEQAAQALRQELQTSRDEAALLSNQPPAQVSQQELDAARQELRASRDEAELLLLQLHQVQEELEHYYLAWKEQDAKADAAVTFEASDAVRVQRAEVGVARDVPPHRHLNLTFEGVSAADRSFPRIELRLLEHHGRPGLALFAEDGQSTPLMAWRASGSENGRDFLLLVPHDAPARQFLQMLGSSDWQFLVALVARIGQEVSETGSASARWRVVAERLNQQLAELPPRLRFDRVVVDAAADSPGTLEASFEPVSFGARRAERLRLVWKARADGGGMLELLAPADPSESPLLAAWPVDDEGRWAPRWRLPLAGVAQPEREQAWRALGATDRDLLLGLLDALPAVAQRAKEQGMATPLGADALLAAAAQPLRVALATLRGTPARRVWRALRGRVIV